MDSTKMIKVLAVIALVIGILGLIAALLELVGGGAIMAISQNDEFITRVTSNEQIIEMQGKMKAVSGKEVDIVKMIISIGVSVLLIGFISLISAIANILEGVFGLKAAWGVGAQAAFFIGITETVMSVIGIFLGKGSTWCSGIVMICFLVSTIVAVLYTYCAKQIKDMGC